MGINSATLKFKNDLVALINSSNLPICNVEMVMRDALSAVQADFKRAVEAEKLEEKKKEESEVKSDD